ncbi:MAG: DUF2076 family protein [Acetobacteraceae bacterium]
MTNEERDIIAAFIARVGGAAPTQGVWGGASVPATQSAAPPLPPVDPEADAFIAQQFQANPEARYRLTQLAFVQEHALVEAQNRLRRAEWELQQVQQSAQQPQGGPRQGGFFSGLFGGGARQGPGGPPGQQYAGPPPPQYPPGYQPGAFQRAGGSGFLGSALTTAAGVAGGVLAADAIRSMFSPHEAFGGGMGGGFGATPGFGAAPDQGYVDQGTWDQGAPDQSNWNDPGSAAPDDGGGGGGWDQGSGGGDWGGDSGGDSGGGGDDSLT